MSELDLSLKLELIRVLEKNGLSYSQQSVNAFLEQLKAEGFVQDESGSFWSPSGEGLVTAVYRNWTDSAPANASAPSKQPTEADERALHGGYLKADFEKMTKWEQHVALESAKGAPPSKFKQSGLPAGVSASDFAAMSPEQKIAAANEATRIANNLPRGGVGF